MKVPVSNPASSSVKVDPFEYEPNLALVYLRTRSGPQGPNPHVKYSQVKITSCRTLKVYT